MKPFPRRTYRSLSEVAADFRAIMARRGEIRSLMRGGEIDAPFRERLMLAVTAVNGCRYCSFVHAREALAAGLTEGEIASLGQGEFEGCPPEQLPALLYAQHWAESRGRPDPAARQRVLEAYGERAIDAIELALRMIQMGNLSGNTADWLLYRLSFGRLGVGRAERAGQPHRQERAG